MSLEIIPEILPDGHAHLTPPKDFHETTIPNGDIQRIDFFKPVQVILYANPDNSGRIDVKGGRHNVQAWKIIDGKDDIPLDPTKPMRVEAGEMVFMEYIAKRSVRGLSVEAVISGTDTATHDLPSLSLQKRVPVLV